MELRKYFQIIVRWMWLLILGMLLGGATGYFASQSQQRIYQASTKILVSRAPDQAMEMAGNYYDNQQLAQTYIQLLTTQPVLDSTSKFLGYPVSSANISAQLMANTLLVRVTVEDPDPQHAAEIANTLVQVLIDQNDQIQASRFTSSEESLRIQLNDVEKQIADLQQQIAQISEESLKNQKAEVKKQIDSLQERIVKVQHEINTINPPKSASAKEDTPLSAEQLTRLQEKELRLQLLESTLKFYQDIYLNLNSGTVVGSTVDAPRLEQLQSNLTQYQNIYANLLNSYEAMRLARLRSTPNLVQVEKAIPPNPNSPIRPQPIRSTFFGAGIGLILTAAISMLVENLDETIKRPEDVNQLVGVSVIGYIPDLNKTKKEDENEQVIVAEEPRSPFSEAFRSLRTNLEFSSVDKPLRIVLVTSPSPAEGKTTVSVNLAMSLAQGGKRVVLVDADMRRPKIHRFLGLSNRIGLSDIFINHRTVQAIARPWRDTQLLAITSGSLPPNPAELLASERMIRLLENLKEICDIVVVDCPPILVSDASVLASRVDGVLLVLNPGRTHKEATRAAAEQLKHVNARILGVVFNRIPRNRSEYYGGYYHYARYSRRGYNGYYNYYYGENGHKSKKQKKSKEIDHSDHYVPQVVEQEPTPDQAVTQPVRVDRK